MKIGASVGPDIEDVANVPKQFDFVEIAIGEREVAPEDIDVEQLESDLEQKDLGLVVHLPFRQPLATTVDEFNEALVDYYDRLLRFSADLGAEKAVVHLNLRYGQEFEDVEDKLHDQIKALKVLEERHGVELVYENLPFGSSRAVDLEDLPSFAEQLGVSVCLDTGHAFAESGQEGLEDFLDEAGEELSHLHVQDSMDGDDSHVAVGHGDIDWKEVGSRLEEFEGTATLEIFTNDWDYAGLSREKLLEYVD